MPPNRSDRIRVLFIDHTAGVLQVQRKFDAVAEDRQIDLTVFGPDRWVENYRPVRMLDEDRPGYRLRAGRVVWPGFENRAFFTSGIADAIRGSRPHLIHLWEEPFSFITLQALLFRRRLAPEAAVVFSTSDNLSFGFQYPYRGSWLYARIERIAHRDCAAALAINRRVVENLRSKGFSKPIEILPHGVDLEPYASPPIWPPLAAIRARSGLVIGFVGRLLPVKGIDLLIRAFGDLESGGERRLQLAIVGEGPELEALRSLARELGLSERVTFLGAVPQERVPSVLTGMDVLVLPSRSLPDSVEQFGRVLIEGMAARCAVIGSTSGGIPEVIGDAGRLFAEGSVESLAACLREVLRDPDTLATLRARARKRVEERFTWDAVAAQLSRLYRSVLSESRS